MHFSTPYRGSCAHGLEGRYDVTENLTKLNGALIVYSCIAPNAFRYMARSKKWVGASDRKPECGQCRSSFVPQDPKLEITWQARSIKQRRSGR